MKFSKITDDLGRILKFKMSKLIKCIDLTSDDENDVPLPVAKVSPNNKMMQFDLTAGIYIFATFTFQLVIMLIKHSCSRL